VQRYQYRILQEGALPLRPDGEMDSARRHQCSALLIWPAEQTPDAANTVLTDPCFTRQGFVPVAAMLAELDVTFQAIGHVFISHHHGDHLPRAPEKATFARVHAGNVTQFADLAVVSCPGHADDACALAFRSVAEQTVWVVGDAVLDQEWLVKWGYYWPNLYSADEVRQTWRSVAAILRHADLVIPGHGAPIEITAALLEQLIAAFPAAQHASRCPDVLTQLQQRRAQFA